MRGHTVLKKERRMHIESGISGNIYTETPDGTWTAGADAV